MDYLTEPRIASYRSTLPVRTARTCSSITWKERSRCDLRTGLQSDTRAPQRGEKWRSLKKLRGELKKIAAGTSRIVQTSLKTYFFQCFKNESFCLCLSFFSNRY